MHWRNNNMLLRIAQADACAAAVEYVKRPQYDALYAETLKFEAYQQHPTHSKLRPGMYTDDTQMSIAVAETLLEHNVGVNTRHFSDAFFNVFKRDPRDGYSRGFQAILEQATSADHMRQLIKPDSNKNGAAMRSVPVGVFKKPVDVIRIAAEQAMITHATWGGINSAISIALMSHFALYDRRDFSSMHGWCCNWSGAHEFFREPWRGPVTKKSDTKNLGIGMCTAWAVQTLLVEEKSLMDIMKRLISWGGDTDSVAAIAWGIASCRYTHEQLPDFLERDLEAFNPSCPGDLRVAGQGSPKYGPVFLKELGTRLMDVYA